MRIIAVDGHDGSGKTTLARNLAAAAGGKYVKPFNDSLGDHIAWLWGGRNFDLASEVALSAIDRMIDKNRDESLLVFDRHWLTMFSVLPEELFANWTPRMPETVLCWADPDITMSRLAERGERVGDPATHLYYCSKYKDLAEKFGVPVLDTSFRDADDALKELRSLFAC